MNDRQKTVMMVLFEEGGFPPDIRVEKEIQALAADGWRIIVLTFNTGSQPQREGFGHSATVVRVAKPFKNRFWKSLFYLHPEHQPELSEALRTSIRREQPDVLHVHDLIYAGLVLKTVAPLGFPVVLDLHENMPAAFAVHRMDKPIATRVVSALTQGTKRWKRLEKRWLDRADAILLVVEEARTPFEQTPAILQKTTIVGNTENQETFPLEPDAPGMQSEQQNGIRLLYIGAVGPHRGIDTVLKGLARLPESAPVTARIVGLRPEQLRSLEREADRLGISCRLELEGWVPKDQVATEIAAADIGLVPHAWTEHTNTTVPHKLYQYLMLSRPVLVSSCPPLKRIVEEHDVGAVFQADDPDDFARVVQSLYEHPAALDRYKKKARSVATRPLSWSHDAERLRSVYRNLVASHGQQRPV